ncbi:MAG: helix-turn-helix transcriptional regulator [Pelolinea sp.]|nr:helix-turn-helix transcriptional regulator [Pelolinea sp.]
MMSSKKKTIHKNEYHLLIHKLINARKEAGLTQSDVSIKFKCSQSYISKIENCQIRIDPIQLKTFAELYKIDVFELI